MPILNMELLEQTTDCLLLTNMLEIVHIREEMAKGIPEESYVWERKMNDRLHIHQTLTKQNTFLCDGVKNLLNIIGKTRTCNDRIKELKKIDIDCKK